MWTRRISSNTPEYPRPKDVLNSLLDRLLEKAGGSSWMHVELIAEGGWFKNVLWGKQPFVEIAFVDEQTLELMGFPVKKQTTIPEVPAHWRKHKKHKLHWTVPASEKETMIDWAEKFFVVTSGRSAFQVSGWIEGL